MDQSDLAREIEELYQAFTHAGLNHHYTSYFSQLRVCFKYGDLGTKIHALELILNIVLGGKWSQRVTSPGHQDTAANSPPGVGFVQFRVDEINRRLNSEFDESQQENQQVLATQEDPVDTDDDHEVIDATELEEAKSQTLKVPIDQIIDWLFETLPTLHNEKLLTVYFIFYSTHWEHIQATDPDKFHRLSQLHNQLMENPKYAKIKAFERLNMDYFSSGYRPPS